MANIWKWLFIRSRWKLKETSAWWHLKYGVDRSHGWEETWASVSKSSFSFPNTIKCTKNLQKQMGNLVFFDGKYGRMPSICQKHQGWNNITWRHWEIPYGIFLEIEKNVCKSLFWHEWERPPRANLFVCQISI